MAENCTSFRNEVMFGFWPEAETLSWSAGRIEPLSNHQEIVYRVLSSAHVQSGWYESGDGAFTLASTHVAQLDDNVFDDQGADFIVALVGILRGLRLQREEWQHLRRTPVVVKKLCDFRADCEEMEKAIDIASVFWSQAKPEVKNLAFGALHWHLFAQTYKHDFEKFNAQYMALDACHKLAMESFPGFIKAKLHANRASEMCSQLGIPEPQWARTLDGQTTSFLAERRNALAHEAMYGGKPIGFSCPQDLLFDDNGACVIEKIPGEDGKGKYRQKTRSASEMTLELQGLVARLFLRLIGVENEYTQSECTTAQTIGFSFPVSPAK